MEHMGEVEKPPLPFVTVAALAQVGAAVAMLTDASKRQRYDAGWSEEEIEQGCQAGGGMGGMHPEHMDDLLAAMFGGGGMGGMGGRGFPGGGFPGGGYGGGGFASQGGYGGRSSWA